MALLGLRERGLVTLVGPRVQSGPQAAGGHPVERALAGLCPRGKGVGAVLAAVAAGPEVAEVRTRLRAAGMLGRVRARPTAAGRRERAAARASGAWPAYVFDGPPAVPDRLLRRVVQQAHPLPTGLGRSLIRMGRALDRADHRDDDHGGGASCGGGGGGGD